MAHAPVFGSGFLAERMKTVEHVFNRLTGVNAWLRQQKELHATVHKEAGAVARQLREKAGLSLRDVAAEMEITYPFLADLELGRRTWTTATAESWQKALRKLSK